MLIISYIRRVIEPGSKVLNLIKLFKGYILHRSHNSNINSRQNRREHSSHKLEKVDGSKEDFIFQNQK